MEKSPKSSDKESYILSPKIWKSLGSFYVYDVVDAATSFILTSVLLNYLGEELFGLRGVVYSLVGWIILLDLGLGSTITKRVPEFYVSKRYRELNEVITSAFVLYLGLTALGLIVYLSFLPFLDNFFTVSPGLEDLSRSFFIICAVRASVNLPLNILGSICAGLGRFEYFNLVRSLSVLTNFLLIYWGTIESFDLAELELLSYTGLLMTPILNFVILNRLYPEIKIRFKLFNFSVIKSILSFSIFFFFSSLIHLIVFQTDNIVIGSLLGLSSVSAYLVSQKLLIGLMQFTFKICETLFPTFSGLFTENKFEELRKAYFKALKNCLLLSIFFSAVLVFYGDFIIEIWTGPKGYAGKEVIWIFSLSFLFHVLPKVAITVCAAAGKLNKVIGYSLAEAFLNVVLSILLAKEYGVLGVALGTLISMLIANTYFIPAYCNRLLKIDSKSFYRLGILPGLLYSIPTVALIVIADSIDLGFGKIEKFTELALFLLLGSFSVNKLNLKDKESI